MMVSLRGGRIIRGRNNESYGASNNQGMEESRDVEGERVQNRNSRISKVKKAKELS